MKNILIFTLLSLAFIANDIQAQCVFNVSNQQFENIDGSPCVNSLITALPFLRINPDARSAGLGDAGLTLSADPGALYFNASKLAFAEDDLGLGVSYTPWLKALGLNDVYMAYISGYKRLNDLSTVGFGLKYFRLGSIQFKGPNGEDIGEGNPNEFELNGAYTRKLSEKLSVGLSAKFIYSNLAAGQAINNVEITPATAGAADISLTYITPIDLQNGESELTIAAAATNIGTKVSYTQSVDTDFLPANLGIGVGYKLDLDQYNQLTFVTDFNKLLVPTPCIVSPETPCEEGGNPNILDYREQGVIGSIFNSFGDAPGGFSEELREITYSLGVEYWYDQQFAIRAGYFGESSTKGARKYFTLGLGLKYNIFGIDFSYLVPTNSERSPLDNTLRFALSFDFGAAQEGGNLKSKL